MSKLNKFISILLVITIIFSLFTIIPFEAGAVTGVSYIYRSWDGEKVVEEVRTCTDYTELSERASDELSNGKYVVSHDMTVDSRLYVKSGTADLILCDGATLTLTSGITVHPQARLNIYGQSNGTGKIYAHMTRGSSYYECAVIGGDKNEDSGDIYIYDATFDLDNGEGHYEEIVNGYDGACIGGGNNSGAGEIVIYGGNIKVDSMYAAGIGGGKNGQASWKSGESIRIYGGTINAHSYEGAAIGNGVLCNGSTGGIAIYGGEVTANGKASGAGIGGGGYIEVEDAGGSNGPITIYGGVVAASGTDSKFSGAGIGSGGKANQGDPIRILGGTVVSISDRGAGIGSGSYGNAGKIEISNANVVASSFAWGAGIGGGNEGSSSEIIISDSTVSAVSCNYGSAQDFLNSYDQMVTYRKMKSNDQAFVDSALNAITLLVELFQRDYSGSAIGGGRHGYGGDITIINSTIEAECGNYAAAIGGGQSQSFDTITIDHSTIEKANSSCDGAGIGSGDEAPDGGGTIRIINGSDVKATAGTDAAGIGTGDECGSPCNEIVILDSSVEAHGGRYGAGIGGGDAVSGGNISISNSTVTADSKTDGAGIGGGESGDGGNISITGNSTVTAHGGGYAAGIGGGDHASGGNITIENSIVRAYGGTDAAGIGGGESGEGGNISIYNSNVYAEGKEYGSGIGGGEDAGVSSVSITGSSSHVEALAGSVTYGGRSIAIGHGDYNSFWSSRPDVGELTLNSTLKVKSGIDQTLSSVEYTSDSRFDIMRDESCKHILVYPCDHSQTVLAAYDIDDHRLRCVQCREWINDPEPHDFDDDDICIDCGTQAKKITMLFVERDNSSEVRIEENPRYNSYYVMPECTHTPDGMEFTYWRISYEYDGDIISEYYAPGQEFYTGNRNAEEYSFEAVYFPVVEARYIDEDGYEQTVTAREINSSTDCFTLSSGWYYVSDDAVGTSDYDQLVANGVVNIIIADGKTLRVTGDSIKKKGDISKRLDDLQMRLDQRQTDMQDILLERIRDKAHEEIYTKMLMTCDEDIERIKQEMYSITHYNATIKKRKAEMKESIDIIEQIIEEGEISDANLRLLVDSIVISEKDKKLHITINLNARFEQHKDCYDEDGNLTERVFTA
ncbi:MAG: hypothetical protein IJH07_08670 [Ruminococcus sp.]|nr:hypothetical protein [Ruminococcus sp.]